MKIRENFWYKNSIIYNLEVGVFKDSDGDGRGDFNGLIQKLDYIKSLGVDAICLAPFQPSPGEDDGYDVADYYGVDPKLGTSGDFNEFMFQAQKKQIRVIMDLVPNVMQESQRIIAYWLNQGISGFRLDAVPFIIEVPKTGSDKPKLDFDFLTDMRQFAQSRKADAAILGEANVMIGLGVYKLLDSGSPDILAIRYDYEGRSLIILHNFSEGNSTPRLLRKNRACCTT